MFVSAQLVPAATFNVADGDVAALKEAMEAANGKIVSEPVELAYTLDFFNRVYVSLPP